MNKIVPVILCGGSGTRLWPRSTPRHPKPFLPLLGNSTLFRQTLQRTGNRTDFSAPLVVIGEQQLELARSQAEDLAPDARYIVEPVGRNTAPAIALAAHCLDADDVMLVCPSDHHILDQSAFAEAARAAFDLAQDDWLVAFGIEAAGPETGYGYIRRGAKLLGGYRVHSFVEKPDRDTALSFLADGNYAWNGGIFAFRAGQFLAELAEHRPEMSDLVERAFRMGEDEGNRFSPDAASFAEIDGESIDYAVMENTARAAMVDAPIGWSDIGNWDALMDKRPTDETGNVVVGRGEVIDAEGTMIDSEDMHVTVIGVDDIVVVVEGDDILVTARKAVQRVGEASRCRK